MLKKNILKVFEKYTFANDGMVMEVVVVQVGW